MSQHETQPDSRDGGVGLLGINKSQRTFGVWRLFAVAVIVTLSQRKNRDRLQIFTSTLYWRAQKATRIENSGGAILKHRSVTVDENRRLLSVGSIDLGNFATPLRFSMVSTLRLLKGFRVKDAHLPASCLKKLRQRQLVTRQLIPECSVNVHTQPVQQTDRDTAPLDHYIVTWLEHRRNLDAARASAQARVLVVLETPGHILALESQDAQVHEQSTVAVLGEAGQELLAGKVNLHQLLHGLHQ